MSFQVSRVYVGHFMTSLDMVGMSLTLLKLNDHDDELLAAATAAPAWPAASAVYTPVKVPVPVPVSPADQAVASATRPAEVSASGRLLERAITDVCGALVAAEPDLTLWDSKVRIICLTNSIPTLLGQSLSPPRTLTNCDQFLARSPPTVWPAVATFVSINS